MRKIGLACLLGSIVAFVLALKGCAKSLSNLGHSSVDMDPIYAAGFYLFLPLFILGLVFISMPSKKRSDSETKEKLPSSEEETLQEWDRIEEEWKDKE